MLVRRMCDGWFLLALNEGNTVFYVRVMMLLVV